MVDDLVNIQLVEERITVLFSGSERERREKWWGIGGIKVGKKKKHEPWRRML